MYMRPLCGYCALAEKILGKHQITPTKYNIWTEKGRADEMATRTQNAPTVPQIFIDDTHIGGCDELIALEESGNLAALLAKKN